ncbi:MAG: LysM peptidoglycan-binding domain-containing protein [Clostridium sp.]|nr:LysM peptidoglycan-binding domain-containing protein [Clostridium sp.]
MKKRITTMAAILAIVFVFTTFSGKFVTMASGESVDPYYTGWTASDDMEYEDEDTVDDEEDDTSASGYHRADPVDWSSKIEMITVALQTPGVQNINILTGDSFTVPADILNLIAGKNVALALHAGNGLAFSVPGQNLPKSEAAFSVSLIPPSIPEYRKQEILAGSSASYLFNMQEKSPFPFSVNAHVNLGSENAGKVAMLYSYIEADASVRLMGTSRVNEEGQAMFGLQRGGEYIVIVSDNVFGYTVQEGDTFSHIALRNKVSMNALQAVNPQIANISRIRTGQPINIPVR